MKHLGRFLSLITWLLVAGSIVIITGGLFGRPLLMAAVPTGSMVPVLNPGDLIVVLPTWAVHSPGLDDIVIFRTKEDQDWIVHRIVDGNTTEGFVTKGDANQTPDPDRVFPRHMAGVVPQWRGGALRLPRLGLLSLQQGPLSSPAVAGIALAMGMYLLFLDARPRVKLPRFPRPKQRPRADAVLSLYAGLAASAFLSTLIPAWTLSSREFLKYQVVASRPINLKQNGVFLQGQTYHEEVKVKNPSPLPLVVTFRSGDPNVTYSPWWAMVPAHSEKSFHMTVLTPDLGERTATLQMGVFLPLLPPIVVAGLARTSLSLTALVLSLVPVVAVGVIALMDPRSQVALGRLRARLSARFM